MEGYDLISDSYSAEVIIFMIVERMWSKISVYLKRKDINTKAVDLEKRLSKMETDIAVNTAIDKHERK